MDKSPQPHIASRKELEDTTGYSTVKDKTLEMLDNIAKKKTVHMEALYSVTAELSHRLEVTSPSTIISLINALAPIDEYLQRHCINVSLLNGLIGRWMGLPKRDVDKLILVGLLHDCGKALVPPKVLNAPRMLTVVEFEVIKMHPVYTYELLTEFPESLRLASRGHHEKVSGTGYPDRLSLDKIPFEACITAVSDIFDAMVSQRSYKKARSPFTIMSVLNKLRNSDLDARLVNIFNRYMPVELVDKPVMMSNGTIGIVRAFDPDDIEYPMIEVNGKVIKSSENLFCTSMYTRD
jgi:HD-GYP domain-containing protein (c-di-GMP phosphodiesterase class II)